MHGISADRAVNGRDCVNMLGMASEDKYFMILMDIQMPVLNGLEATKEIRQMDNKKKAEIPIIAMTANAFAKDVNDCLDAGMNTHIAKPINLNLLMEEIKKYMGRK
ncbi:MAG: response regulator [Ruminiclostridium sp.]